MQDAPQMWHQRVFRRIAEDDGWGEGVEVESEADEEKDEG